MNDRNTSIMQGNSSRPTSIMGATNIMNADIVSRSKFNWMVGDEIVSESGKTYLLEEYLSEGGEGVVYRCSRANQNFVIKIYDKIVINHHVLEKRQKLIDVLYKKRNPYILPLEDFGTVKAFDRGRDRDFLFDICPYMENGNILSAELKDLHYIKNVVIPNINEALAFLHQNDIVHKDVKPQNILISNDKSKVLLSDFGIMSMVDQSGGGMTQTNNLTYGYAAPEIYGNSPHIKSDYYAFGITLLTLLNGGRDIFEDLSEPIIQQKTMQGTILESVHLDVRKFMDMDETGMTIREQIEGLIVRLTFHNVQERWGFQQVLEWSQGMHYFPIVHTKRKDDDFSDPFIWQGKKYYNPEEMARALAEDWNNTKRPALTGTFTRWIEKRRTDISVKLDELLDNLSINEADDEDSAFFQYIYTLCPEIKHFYWKGEKYTNITNIADEFNKDYASIDISFSIFLRKEGISWFLKKTGLEKTLSEKELICIQEIENVAKNLNKRRAYYMFMYQFMSPLSEKKFKVLDYECRSIDDLIRHMLSERSLDRVCSDLYVNPMFSAWMWQKGHNALLDRIKENTGRISNEEKLRRLLTAFEQIVASPEPVRQLAISKGEYAHVFWLQKNLDSYEYLNADALKMKKQIKDICVDKSMSVENIYRIFMNSEELYKQFTNKTYSNAYKLVAGTVNNNEIAGILPKKASACFAFYDEERHYPAGYIQERGNKETLHMYHSETAVWKKNASVTYEELSEKLNNTYIFEKRRMEEIYSLEYGMAYWFGYILLLAVLLVASLFFGKGEKEAAYLVEAYTIGKISTWITMVYPIAQIILYGLALTRKSFVNKVQRLLYTINDCADSWRSDVDILDEQLDLYYRKLSGDVLVKYIADCNVYNRINYMKESVEKVDAISRKHTNSVKAAYILTNISVAVIVLVLMSLLWDSSMDLGIFGWSGLLCICIFSVIVTVCIGWKIVNNPSNSIDSWMEMVGFIFLGVFIGIIITVGCAWFLENIGWVILFGVLIIGVLIMLFCN